MSKNKKILIFIVLSSFFAGLLVLYLQKKEKSDKQIVITMREYVLGSFLNELPEINKNLPSKIDNYTTLNIIKYEDEKIVSIYELSSYSFSLDFFDKIKLHLKNQACKDEMKRNFLEVDIDLLEKYLSPTGDILFEVAISKEECT